MLDEDLVAGILGPVDAHEEHVRSGRHLRIHVKHILLPDKGFFQSDARRLDRLHLFRHLRLLRRGNSLLLRGGGGGGGFRHGFHDHRRLLVECARVVLGGARDHRLVRRPADVMIAREFDRDEVIAWIEEKGGRR